MKEYIVFNLQLLKSELLLCSFIMLILFPVLVCNSDMIIECVWGCIFTFILIITAVMDYKYLLLFNKLTYTLFLLGIIKNGIDGFIGGVIFGGIMLCIKGIKPEGMGWGDVKFAMGIGSWIYDEEMLLVMAISFTLGAVFSLLLMIVKWDFNLKQCIPFGPFLSVAGFMVYILGDRLWV